MDVIWHDDKRDELVQGANSLAIANGLGNAFGDSRLLEPGWAERCALEFAVGYSESVSVTAGSQGRVPYRRNVMKSSAPSGWK
jgi:hypothetical protein